MTGLIADLPLGLGADDCALGWLIAQMRSGEAAFANGLIALQPGVSDSLALSFADRGGAPLLSVPCRIPAADTVEVAPGVSLQPADQARLTDYLAAHWLALDHVGINLCARDLAESDWRAAVERIGEALPAYRLEIGAANDIVMVVAEDANEQVSALELVYDRAAAQSSLHVCVRLSTPRALVDAEFPEPVGAYKPGDEAFFRSVALPYIVGMPTYLDLAFSDAQMGPWPQIVAAMGRRVA